MNYINWLSYNDDYYYYYDFGSVISSWFAAMYGPMKIDITIS